jgi:hypothetical protein
MRKIADARCNWASGCSVLAGAKMLVRPGSASCQIAVGEPPPVFRPHIPVKIGMEGLGLDSFDSALGYVLDETRKAARTLGVTPPERRSGMTTPEAQDWLLGMDGLLATAGFGGLALLIDDVHTLFKRA